jgi:hypothetical protein
MGRLARVDLIGADPVVGSSKGSPAWRQIRGTAPLAAVEAEGRPAGGPTASGDGGSEPHNGRTELALLVNGCPAVVGTAMGICAHRTEAMWRSALDHAVDRLLRHAGDDGLWLSAEDGDVLQVTVSVVRGLTAYMPMMPATRAFYVQRLLRQTAASVRAMRRPDGDWGSSHRTAAAIGILSCLEPQTV